jgi:lipopolysaccharide heptosyltransferase II
MTGWASARRLLAVRLDTIGDVLMTTPALRALRGRDGHVTLLTSPTGAEAARLVPEVDDVIVYEAPWLKATPPDPPPDRDLAMVEELRRRRFDAAAIFTVYSQNPLPAAFLCHLAGISLRVAHSRENPYHLLTDWVREVEPEVRVRHEVRRQLDLVAEVGRTVPDERLSLEVPRPARRRAASLLGQVGIDPSRPWLVLHPGATAPSRRYPADSYALAAERLVSDHGVVVVLTGSPDEVALVDELRARVPAATASLAGRLSLAELAALLELAPLLVANNSGPVHVAAAVGTPVVDLYALTNPQHTPWGVPNRVLFRDVPCRFCYRSVCPMGHHHCLRLVSPDQVVDAALELLAERWPALAPRRSARRRQPLELLVR